VIETVNLVRGEDMEENRSHQVFVTGAVVGAISFVTTALRVFIRMKDNKPLGTDDGNFPELVLYF